MIGQESSSSNPNFFQNDLRGIEEYEALQEPQSFTRLYQQIKRVDSLSLTDKFFSYHSGWDDNGAWQVAFMETYRYALPGADRRIIYNHASNQARDNALTIKDFFVGPAHLIGVTASNDSLIYAVNSGWQMEPKSGPHLQYRGDNKLQMPVGDHYRYPRIDLTPTKLSERIHLQVMANELTALLETLNIVTREDDATL